MCVYKFHTLILIMAKGYFSQLWQYAYSINYSYPIPD